jgi:hypothetical protein
MQSGAFFLAFWRRRYSLPLPGVEEENILAEANADILDQRNFYSYWKLRL